MEGGFGYTPNEVGDMTLDQVFMLLAKRENLRAGDTIVQELSSLETLSLVSKDGTLKGRARDGTKISGKFTGKSKCAQLREEAEAKRAAEKKNTESGGKRRRRGR